MSRIGKLPITIKEGISVTLTSNEVKLTGPKGVLAYTIPQGIKVKQEEDKLVVEQTSSDTSALFGLARASLNNMVEGVGTGFEKKLELSGVGYRAQTTGAELTLSLGFSHPIKIKAKPGITFMVAENTITVAGMDKSVVGDIASHIRSLRPPEPYKGKGISYSGERIRRKAGKAAKAVGGK
jgi:large subunit ribosomal protein L6